MNINNCPNELVWAEFHHHVKTKLVHQTDIFENRWKKKQFAYFKFQKKRPIHVDTNTIIVPLPASIFGNNSAKHSGLRLVYLCQRSFRP